MKSQIMKPQYIIRFFVMAFIAVFTCSAAMAQENSQPGQLAISVTQPDSGKLKFMVMVGNPNKQKVELKVTNASYGTIDRTVFRSTQYGMICNLSEAADGVYTIELRSGKEKIRRTIAINTVSVYKTNRQASFAAISH